MARFSAFIAAIVLLTVVAAIMALVPTKTIATTKPGRLKNQSSVTKVNKAIGGGNSNKTGAKRVNLTSTTTATTTTETTVMTTEEELTTTIRKVGLLDEARVGALLGVKLSPPKTEDDDAATMTPGSGSGDSSNPPIPPPPLPIPMPAPPPMSRLTSSGTYKSYLPQNPNRWTKASFDNFTADGGILSFHENASESDIKTMLLTFYDRTSRPVYSDTQAVKVTVGFSLYNILDTNEKFHTISTLLSIRLRWRDNFLRWKSDRIKSLYIPADRIWVPDIVFANSAEATNGYMNTNTIVQSNGDILWMFPILLKSQCIFQVFFFPFDCQKCKIVLISWTYSGRQVDLKPDPSDNNAVYYNPRNQEWFVDKINVSRNVVNYECCPNDTFPDVTFTIYLRRRSQFYVLNLIYPCLLFYILSFLGFLLPLESGDKVNMEVTVLLSLVVFMMFVNEMLPPTSDMLPAIGMIVVTTMIEVVVALCMAVAVTYLAHKNVSPQNIPTWLGWALQQYGNRKIVKRYKQALLAYKVCEGNGKIGSMKSTVEKKPSPVFNERKRFVQPQQQQQQQQQQPFAPPPSPHDSGSPMRKQGVRLRSQPSTISEEPQPLLDDEDNDIGGVGDEMSFEQLRMRMHQKVSMSPRLGVFLTDGESMLARSFNDHRAPTLTVSSQSSSDTDDDVRMGGGGHFPIHEILVNDNQHADPTKRRTLRYQKYWMEIARITDRVFLVVFGVLSGSINIFLYLIMLADDTSYDVFSRRADK